MMPESMIKLNEQMDCLKVKLKYAEDWKQIKDLTAQLNQLRLILKEKADKIRQAS
jgi:hypothetical protein